MPFANTELLLSDTKLAQITSALANGGFADPIGKVVAECGATVDRYTAGLEFPDEWRDRLIRALAPAELYRLLGSVPEAHQTAHDAAIRELEAIRDGKFNLPASTVAVPIPAATGKWGGACRKLAFLFSLLIFPFALVMPASVNFRPTLDVLNACVSKLTALKWTPPGGSEQPLFSSVEIFDEPDLKKAVQRLSLAGDRNALVMFVGETFAPLVQGRVVVTGRTHELLVWISDSVLGDERGAMCGTPTHPGTLGIKDLVYGALTGELLSNPLGVVVHPVDAEPVFAQVADMPGRALYSISFAARGGWIEAEESSYSPIF